MTIVKVKKWKYDYIKNKYFLTQGVRYNTNLKMKKLIKLCFKMKLPFAVSVRIEEDIIDNFDYIEIIGDNYFLIDYLERNRVK